MGKHSIDFTAPDTLKLAAALPFYGQAAVIIRRIDPLWKVDIDEPREWEVHLEQACGCNCPHCEPEFKSLRIEAVTPEEAQETAEAAWKEWEVTLVRLPIEACGKVPVDIPEEFYAAANAIYEAREREREAARGRAA